MQNRMIDSHLESSFWKEKQSMDWFGRDKSQENQLEAKSCICNEKMDGEQGINFRHIYNKKIYRT